jgi:hypothetical protein
MYLNEWFFSHDYCNPPNIWKIAVHSRKFKFSYHFSPGVEIDG